MPKNKRVYPAVGAPVASHEEHAGGSPKKKKRKSKSYEEEEMTSSSALSQSFSSISSPGLSPNKKKKKKKKEGKKMDAAVNGIVEKREEEILGGKTKKKKPVAVKEEEIQDEEEGNKKIKKKKDNKEGTPKKRKIGKTPKEEMERSQEEEEEEEEQQEGEDIGMKKKTKKKAKKKDVVMTSPSSPASITTPTTRKNQKIEKEEEEEWKIEVEDEEIDTELENDNAWPEEVTEELLSRIASQLPPPKRDTRSCRISLKSVDWEKAAIPGRSPDVCKEHFMTYYRKINPFKNLTTVLDEVKRLATSGLSDPRNRPILPRNRFMKDFFTPEIMAEAKRKGESIFALAHKAWKNLPQHQKDVYTRSYNEELSKMKLRVSSKNKSQEGVELPKLPYQFCWEAKGQAESNMSIRSYYASLPPHKQLPYIRSALEDMMRYESDLQDYLASHPEHQPPSYHPIAKNDLKTYLDAHGLPALPASRPSLVFYKEVLASGQLSTMPGLQRMSEAMKMYKDVTRVEKANYKKKCEEEAEQFEEDLKEWSSEQDEVTLFALKKYREVVTLSRLLKPKRAHHTKVDDIFPHKAAAATSCPKFLGEPARPPATPYHLFSSKYRASVSETLSGPDIQRTLRDGWKALDEEEKKVYVDRCCALHKQYERKIKDYVQEMDPKTRRLFLGFNRVSLYRFFNNRDVFEEFPNSERYPLLVKGELHSSSPSKLSHHQISDHEDNKQEEEEEEEEEEILLAFPSSKKKKSLTPLLFSSLELSPTNKGSKTKLAPTATSPKKNTAQQPPCSKSEEESEDEEEIDITSDWHPPAPAAPITQAKKKAHVSVAAANAGKKSKAPRAPPPPESESESEESEDEVNVTPAVPTATTHSKKKAHVPVAAANAGKKSKASRAPQPPESESESEESEDEEDVTPAWHSPAVPTATTHAKKQQKSQLQRLQQKKQDYSSSSGFSDSDSSS